ncbi:MAG TPA: DUF3352 domain-containing protein [Nocardioides sp.]|nr:DUF3352 domain-containing protein [Nocardioides sp.]
MSSNLPPEGPQGPEYLEQGSGSPLGHEATPKAARGRKTVLIAAVAVVALLVGGGVWAWTAFVATGPQPAEALPASTLGYASIDLDPSGAQKIEAVSMLRKFPAFKDRIGLDTDDDIRKKIFEEILQAGDCEGTDYADDIEPWIGARAAIAAVDTGKDVPAPVLVVQVTDEGLADEGLGKLQDCAATQDDAPSGGWAIDGEWAVIAESDTIAQGIVDDAASSSLADDADYQQWTGEVGDAGIVNLYAAPAAGQFLADNLGGMGLPFGAGSSGSCEASFDGPQTCTEESGTSYMVPSGTIDALEDFQGMAATIRFDNGAVELEVAGDPGMGGKTLYDTDGGDDVLATLPDDTAAAFGGGFEDGWFTAMVDQMAASSGGEMSADELMSELANGSGLDLPDDAETLAGESVALSLGSDFDPETLMNSSDGSEVPIGMKVKGDPDAIDAVLDKVRGRLGPGVGTFLETTSDGDMIAIGPNPDYRTQILEEGTLGDSSVFQDVVREAERASAIFFVNFDAGDGWLADLAGGDPTVEENLEPLGGFGISVWQEDEAAHALLRLTTD